MEKALGKTAAEVIAEAEAEEVGGLMGNPAFPKSSTIISTNVMARLHVKLLVSTPRRRRDTGAALGRQTRAAALPCFRDVSHANALQAAAAGGDEDSNAGARAAELQTGASDQVHVDSDPDVSPCL